MVFDARSVNVIGAGADVRQGDGDDPFLVSERFGGVRDQVHHDAADLCGVGADGGQVSGEIDRQHGAFGDRDVQELKHLVDQRGKIERFEYRVLLSRIGHHLAHDFGGAIGHLLDGLNAVIGGRLAGKLRQDEFRGGENTAEEIIEIVGDAAGQDAETFQFLPGQRLVPGRA